MGMAPKGIVTEILQRVFVACVSLSDSFSVAGGDLMLELSSGEIL